MGPVAFDRIGPRTGGGTNCIRQRQIGPEKAKIGGKQHRISPGRV